MFVRERERKREGERKKKREREMFHFLYGYISVGHVVKDHCYQERKPATATLLLVLKSSNESFPQTGLYIPWSLIYQSWSIGWIREKPNVLQPRGGSILQRKLSRRSRSTDWAKSHPYMMRSKHAIYLYMLILTVKTNIYHGVLTGHRVGFSMLDPVMNNFSDRFLCFRPPALVYTRYLSPLLVTILKLEYYQFLKHDAPPLFKDRN